MDNARTHEPDEKKKAVKHEDASSLSYVGAAAFEMLERKHGPMRHKLWNVTSGKVEGEVNQTPHSRSRGITAKTLLKATMTGFRRTWGRS